MIRKLREARPGQATGGKINIMLVGCWLVRLDWASLYS